MTSTNDGKDVKSNQTSGPRGKTYYIELYKSLDARLSGDCDLHERTRHLCEAWRRIHSLCQHSAPSTHLHLLSWLQRHTAKTVLQTEWHKSENKDEFHQLLEEAIDDFIKESWSATLVRDGISPPWETQLVQRGEWFQRILANPWGHPTLRVLLDSEAEPPSDKEVLEWLKDERCVMFVTRLRQLAADKHCVDLALLLVSAVMDRVRASEKITPDAMDDDPKDKPKPEDTTEPTFVNVLKAEAGFTLDVWELLTDIEFVLLHKRDKRSKCIELAKQTPLRDGYQLVERLQGRLETSPREKKLWKNAKDVAIIVAQVVVARCMVVPMCAGAARTALYCCARALARLLPPPRLPPAAAALAAPAATARHLHTLAAAVDAQSTADMKPFVCELYVRAITAGMNELERLKLKTEKSSEARGAEALLAAWLTQLGALLAGSTRVRCECALTAFSLHPSAAMLRHIRAAPPLPSVDIQEPKQEETTSEFGSWASDSRSQTNFVKTSETINMKQTQHQANVLSTAILTEGEALGLSPELCQDITVLLSGPRLKTLSWDMDREVLFEKCRVYMERTHGGTRAVTTELKYLNLDPKDFDHLPEEEDDDTDIYYGIEKGYEHLVELYQEPEEIWQDAEDLERTASANSSEFESIVTPRMRRKKKCKKNHVDSDEDSDPLSFVAEAKRTEKKKERPLSKERSKERASAKAKTKIPKDPLATDPLSEIIKTEIKKEGTKEKKKRERKKKEKKIKSEPMSTSLSSLIGMKISQIGDKTEETKVNPLSITDSDYDSQGKSSIHSLNSEGNDPDVLFDGLFSMDELKSPDRNSDNLGLMKNNELHLSNGAVTINSPMKKNNNIQRPINNTSNVLNHSLPSPNSIPNQQTRIGSAEKLTTVTDDVKKSITRLIQFRRQKALNEQRSLGMSPPTISSHATTYKDTNIGILANAITKPQIPLQTQISPKPVDVPDIPKVYINKQQSQQLAEIKGEVDYLLNNQNYVKKPVTQCATMTNANIQSSSKIHNSSTSDTPQAGLTLQNKLQPKPMSRVNELKSQNNASNLNKCATNPKSFNDFLQELQKSINAGIDQSKPEKMPVKKEIRPMSRVTPVLPMAIKADPKTSPQCAKPTTQQKKMENALNTFSRLSYMHKNNKIDLKLKHIEAVIEHRDQIIKNQQALSNMDHIIQEQKHAKFKYLQTNELVISRVNKSSSKPIESSQLTMKVEKPIVTSTRSLIGEHPLISNLLKNSEVSTQKIPAKDVPTKYEDETKHVQVEPRDSPTPVPNRFSALSEKDQNDLLLLLRQQRKQNATQPRFDNTNNYNMQPPQPSPQLPSASNTQQHKYNSTPSHQPTTQIDGPSTSLLVSNTKKLQNTGIKIPQVVRSAVDVNPQQRPVNMAKTEPNCTQNADLTPTKSQKTEAISENVSKIAKTIDANKKTEWESVMNALLSHKTPSRGPNALEMALNKDTFDKNYIENIIRSHRIMTPNSTEDTVKTIKQTIVKYQTKMPSNPNVNATTQTTASKTTIVKRNPKSVSKDTKIKIAGPKQQSQTNAPKVSTKTSEVSTSNPNVTRPVQPVTPKRQHQLDKRPSQTDDTKRPTSSHKKPFTCALPKEDDPFISGIPNSDYDLLEELMDDDLRQEIGELSDDDTFGATEPVHKQPPNSVVVNKDHSTEQHKKRVVTAPVTANRQQTVIKTVQKTKSDNTPKAINPPVHQPSGFVNTQTTLNTADFKVQKQVQATNIVDQVPSNVIATTSCINDVSYMSRQVNHTEQTFITTMPQQNTLKNVVLLSSGIVYQPCTIQMPITNPNSYLAFNNQPNMALYQTTQFAEPVVNPVIIGNAMTVPNSVPIENIHTTTTVHQTSEEINIINQNQIKDKIEIDEKSEVSNQVTNIEAKQDVVVYNTTQSHAEEIKLEKEMIDFNKGCERKVLSEVQKFGVNEKIDMIMTRSRKLSLAPDVKKPVSIDQERLKKKRMAILTRNICHRSDIKPIPLTYVPLKLFKARETEQETNINKTTDEEQEENPTSIKTDSLSNSISQKDVSEPNQDNSMLSAPPVDSPENCKENKGDSPQCRRILLRSSNRIPKENISDLKANSSDITPSDTSSTKTKVKLKLKGTSTFTEDPQEKCNDDISLEPDQKIVLHKKINKKKKIVTSKVRSKKPQAQSKPDKAKRKVRAKTQESHDTPSSTNKAPVLSNAETSFTGLPEAMDIEEQLIGSKIPKNASPPVSESQVRDEDRTVVENPSKCEDIHSNSLIHEQPQCDSSINDNIPHEKQESSLVSNKVQNKVDDVSQATDISESSYITNLTGESLNVNDSSVIKTYSHGRNIKSTQQVIVPEASIIDVGANKLFTARHNVTLNNKEVTNDNVSGTNPSVVDAVNRKHTRDVTKNQDESVLKKICDIKSIPQCYKDSIIIEDLPDSTAKGDPLKKCVRIKLPSGRIFKATVHGKMSVDFDTLFSDPTIKDVLLSNLTDRKRYTLNIKQIATTTKSDNDKILQTRVQEVKLHTPASFPDKMETINLLSDEEDEEPCQYFKTDHGKFRVYLNKDDLAKHQKRFDQKCSVKLKRVNVQRNENTDQSNFKHNNELPKSNPNVSYQHIVTDDIPCIVRSKLNCELTIKKIRPQTVPENKNPETNTSIANEPDVIEIDDSSNDSFELKSGSKKTNPAEDQLTVLKDLLLKDLGIADLGEDAILDDEEIKATESLTPDSNKICNENVIGIVDHAEKAVASTEKLTHDNKIDNENSFGAVDLNEPKNAVEKAPTSASTLTNEAKKTCDDIVDLTDVPKSDPINSLIETDPIFPEHTPTEISSPKLQVPSCYIKLTKCDDLVKIYEQQKLNNKDCYIKLIRCDQNCSEDIVEGAEIVDDNEEVRIGENIRGTIEETLSRSGSFSILNNFDEFDIDLPETEELERSNSPVIDVYEAIAALSNSLTKASQTSKFTENNTCTSEWCMNKRELQFQYKQMISKEYVIDTTDDDTQANLEELVCSKSAETFNAPSLLTILLKFFEDNNHITDQMRPISSVPKIRSPKLKRKSTSLDTGVVSKIYKLNKGEQLVKKNNTFEHTDNSMTVNGSHTHIRHSYDNIRREDISKSAHMESFKTNDVLETNLDNTIMELNTISDNLKEIETQSVQHMDEKSVVTVSSTDFLTENSHEIQHEDKDMEIDKHGNNSCCSKDKNVAVHQIITEIIQKVNEVECVIDGNNDVKIITSDITNKSDDYYLNSDVHDETSTTKDDVALMTIKIDELIHDSTEMSVAESSSNDNKSTNTAAEDMDEQSHQSVEAITAMDITQHNLKISDIQIEIPTSKEDIEVLDDHKEPSAANIDETTLEPIQTPIDIITSENKEICDEQNNQTLEAITAMNINQDDLKISDIQIEIPTSKEDIEVLDAREGPSAANIDKTTLEPIQTPIDIITSENKEICDEQNNQTLEAITAMNINQDDLKISDIQIEIPTSKEDIEVLDAREGSSAANIDKTTLEPIQTPIDIITSENKEMCDEHNNQTREAITAMDINQDNIKISDIQIGIPTTKEDIEVLDDHKDPSAANIDKTTLEPIQTPIDIITSENKETCDYTTADECNGDQNSIKETTTIDIDQENMIREIHDETSRTKEDTVLLDKDCGDVITNIVNTENESTDLLVNKSFDNNEIGNYTAIRECRDEQNSTEIEHSKEVNVELENEKIELQVKTPPTMVLLDEYKSGSSENINKNSFENTEIIIAAPDSHIGTYKAANECTSEQNNTQINHHSDVTTEMDIHQDNISIRNHIDATNSSTDDNNTENVDNEMDKCTNDCYVKIAEDTQHEVQCKNVVVEINDVKGSDIRVINAETNTDLVTEESSDFISIPIVHDHAYTTRFDKSNQLLEPADNSPDQSSGEEIKNNTYPTVSFDTLEIRDDNEIMSDELENVLVDVQTYEMCCGPDFTWSGVETRSQIINPEVHDKEMTMQTDNQVESEKETDEINRNKIVDILDKSEDDNHKFNEDDDSKPNKDDCNQITLSPNLESGILLKGIEYEDPEIGTCYVFPLVTSISESSEYDSDANNIEEVVQIIDDESSDEELKLNVPKLTYSKEHKSFNNCSPLYDKKNRKSLKRKTDMNDIKMYDKKYRKGKGIDYPKTTVAAMQDTAYTKQFKTLLDYFKSVKFSYSLPFHKDYINVQNVLCDWPIQSISSNASHTENEVDQYLFRDVETKIEPTFPNPKEDTTFVEEIAAECEETEYSYSDITETNFNMGFGEGSDRVIQNLEGGDDISKFSAATLSDVKQSQPLLLSESSKNTTNTTIDEIEKLQRHHTFMQLRDRVRSFFRKTKVELSYDWIKENKKDRDGYDASTFPFGLNVPELFEPYPVEAIVQVVQVGQLPVSAAAQNPVTCDPRVTQVSDVSPSQCSAENSPNDSQSAIKTEYTELTTADMSLPLVQDYAQHNHSMAMESQEASNMPDDNIHIETELKSVVKIELMEELPEDNPELNENGDHNYENNESQNNMNNIDYSFTNVDTNVNTSPDNNTNIDVIFDVAEKQHISDTYPQHKQNGSSEKTDQIAHAMNAAGITTTSEPITNTRAHALVNILSQKIRQGAVGTTPTAANTYPKTTSINAMALQQALAQILPPPLNQTNVNDNNQQTQNTSVTPQVLHIVQSKNASGNQITLVDNTQQSVISTPNATPVLHIVQNKNNSAGPTSNGTQPQANTFSGLSLVDAGLQQGGNQLLHIVNTGNQKNTNAGQLLKRVNLLTNLTNVQGSNEQKMVQFVCKSADGKAIQLNAPHQRSMVLRLQPIETPNIQAAPTKPVDSQDISPTPNAANTVPNKETLTPQEIKSRSVYEENYAKFIQNSNSNKTTILEKATSLPKFNQAFGKQVYQDGNQKQNEINNSNSLLSSVNNNNDTSECQSMDNAINLEHITQLSSPPLLLRKSPQTSQAQANLVQQIKQTIAPMNLQTMHGGVIYTRQIPVNIGGGQTINLITVPSTELIDDSTQKHQAEVKFVNQGEMEPSIIKIVPQAAPNTEVSNEDNTHMGISNENSQTTHQPVLTQMRIKLPMLSKTPQMVSGARVVRPSFFQIQRNVIGGTNQQVYQQLVLTAAPPLGQQTIRLPQTQTSRQIKVPTESQSSTESQMSSSTLEQLREFDLVLEQVKERSTVQPNATSSNSAFSKLHTPSSDATDGAAIATSTSGEITQQVLYSIGNNQPLNVAYVNRKATVTAPTTSTYVRSPDSSGIADSPSSSTHIQIPHTVTSDTSSSETPVQSKSTKVSSKPKPRPKASSNPPNTLKLNTVPPKATAQKPLEDELTTQRILYILAEYKEQVENSPDKDKPAPRRRSNPPSNPSGSSKRKKSSSSSRRPGVRDISPIHGEDTCRTMGSEDSSCGTSQGDCNESCIDSHSPQDSPRKVVRKLTFEHEMPINQPRQQPQRNLIVSDGQTITVARGTAGKPATAVLMPANYILPVSMVKGGQQIAIVTNRGPKLLTVGGGEGGTTNALLLQRLIGPAGLKPVLARPGVRHVRLPTAALHNLQAFNLAAASVQPPDSTASPVPAPTPPELIDTRANSSPWTDRESDVKPERDSSPDDSEPWNLPSSADPHDYTYEDTGRTDNMDRTVLDSISDRYSPDMEAQRIFDKMFDVDSKKSYMVDSPRCGYDIDASDCDDKGYHQVVHKRDGSSHRQHRLTHVSAAALRHKYAILEHELRLQKSLSEECEDLGVDSPSASELFPEAELLFAASPAHDHTQDHAYHSHTPQPTFLNQSGIPQPDIDDQIATDQLLTRDHMRDDRADLNLGLEDVGIVTVSEDGMQATIALDQEEFARSHPNTTFHSEPTDDGEVHPFTISGLKGRHITSTIFHSNRPPGTVLMTAPQTTVISQATAESSGVHNVKYDIDNMINSLPGSHANTINLSSVLVKDDGLTRFDSILNDSRELHLSNTASAIVHSAGNATQVIRRVCYDDDKRDAATFLMDEPEELIAGDDAKMIAEDSSRDATLESMADVDDDRSSPERHTELFWESNSASERSESRRPLEYSSDSDKCCKSPSFDETNSTDSSGLGTHVRLDTVIKEARSASGDGSSADDAHPPLRTYPPKRLYHSVERSTSGKTRAGERSPRALEVRRRASARGVVKRGCHCCSGSPAPPRPKKPRQRKPTLDFTAHH